MATSSQNPRTLVVSPNQEVIEQLQRSLGAAGLAEPAEVWSYFPSLSELRRRLREADQAFDAAIFDMSREHEALRLVAALRDNNPETVTIVVNGERRLGAVVRAKQAGAWGYLTEPYDLTELSERLGLVRLSEELGPSGGVQPEGRLVAFLPAQGGAGASTVALNAAISASNQLAGRTLLIDYDFHCGTMAFQLQFEPRSSIADALSAADPRHVDWDQVTTSWKNLSVLTAPRDPSDIDPRELSHAVSLFQAAKQQYRFTVLDLPAPLLRSSAEALEVADVIYVVCTPEITSLHLAKRLIDRISHLGGVSERVRLLVNRVGSWGSLETEHIRKIVGLDVEWALDNDYAAVRKATLTGGPIEDASSLHAQIEQLAAQMIGDAGIASPPQSELTAV